LGYLHATTLIANYRDFELLTDRVMKFYLISLLISTSSIGMSAPVSASEVRIDFGTAIGTLFNPPHRAVQTQADAEVAQERARQAAGIEQVRIETQAAKNIDRVAPILFKWGVARISCAPDAVFINGISNNTVCIAPSDRIAAGYYTYNANREQLVRIDLPHVPKNRDRSF
jgi:hypothetical protein